MIKGGRSLSNSVCLTEVSFLAAKDSETQKVSVQKTSEITSQKKAVVQEEISQKALISEEVKISEVKSQEKLALKEEVKKSAATSLEKSIVHEEVTKSSQASEEIGTQAEIKAFSTQMSITDGQKVTLKANIAGATDVKWVLNGVELTNSEEYRYGVSGSDQTLTIKQASHRDEGILTCIGKTSQGIVKCQYDLTLSKELSDAPAFISQPRSQNINEGQNVLFSCEITGEPSPEIEWFKNNLPISVSSHISVSRSKNVYTLEIRNASVSDSGKYTVKAKNFRGQCSATASLTVIPLIEEPPKEVVLRTIGDASLQGSFSSQSVQMSASKQEASFSSFSSSSASSMTEMKFASMSAQSMSSMQESFVEMSSSSFMGQSSMTHLESSTSRMLKAGVRGFPPKIEALPSDISIDEGKVLTVACAFTGEPTPEITWSCGGRKIQNQEQQGRFHIQNTDDLTTLIIMDIQKQDGGLYTLSLGNEFGSDSATVNINIRSM
uniref:Ig-like domain-containing protein n=1 Tax=Cavia porcellus TaxID=10141 RepID=A0A286XGT2_CAVPO